MEESIALVKYEKLSTKEKLIMYFLIYSFIGWVLESFYAVLVLGHFVKRGFLFGPICPIYGFGAVIFILIFDGLKGHNLKKFFISMIVFSMFEFAASWILELVFNLRWWDYSNAMFNIQGRICLSFSIVWGLAGIIFSNYLHPFIEKKTEKFLQKIAFPIQRATIYALASVLVVDFILSLKLYLLSVSKVNIFTIVLFLSLTNSSKQP